MAHATFRVCEVCGKPLPRGNNRPSRKCRPCNARGLRAYEGR